MKKKVLFSLLLLLLNTLFACNKKDEINLSNLIGDWKLQTSVSKSTYTYDSPDLARIQIDTTFVSGDSTDGIHNEINIKQASLDYVSYFIAAGQIQTFYVITGSAYTVNNKVFYFSTTPSADVLHYTIQSITPHHLVLYYADTSSVSPLRLSESWNTYVK